MSDNNKKMLPYAYGAYKSNFSVYDALYGPWNSFKEMIETVTNESKSDEWVDFYKNEYIPKGLTVGIIEDGKVVEYWNPIDGKGFIKKKSTDVVDSYSDAIKFASEDNIGFLIKVNNSETIDGNIYESGFYVVENEGVISRLGVSSDSIISQLDNYNDDDSNHTFISNVYKKDGYIYPSKNDLDSSNILMSGCDDGDSDDFIEVIGVNVGGLKSGDIISKGDNLESLLKRLLQKEIDVKIGEYPSITLEYAPSYDVLEVGTRVNGQLFYEYTNGYFIGESEEFSESQIANNEITEITYIPSESYDFRIVEGNNIFSVIASYQSSDKDGVKPLTNLGNESNIIIPAGTCKDEKIIRGAYRFFYGNIEYDKMYKESDDFSEHANYLISTLKKGWTNGNESITLGECSNDVEHIFCCLCPIDYELYGEQSNNSIKPRRVNVDYEYTLPNGDKINYVLYVWTSVNQKFMNVKLIRV